VISIRTCYPQTPNGSGPATNRSAKLDMLFSNKVTAISLLKYYLCRLGILHMGKTFVNRLIASVQHLCQNNMQSMLYKHGFTDLKPRIKI